MSISEKRVKAIEKKEREHREKQIRALVLMQSGHSAAEVAKVLGVSEGVIKNIMKQHEKEKEND